jgi:SAM-dependent methyltransferase
MNGMGNDSGDRAAGKLPTQIHVGNNLLPHRSYHVPRKYFVPLAQNEEELVRQLNCRMAAGKVALEAVLCVCGGAVFDLLASIDRYGVRQQTVLCTQCGLVSSNPRMSADEYQAFYCSDLYRRIYSGADYLESCRARYNGETGRHIYEATRRHRAVQSGTRVLEIGAGGGWNLLPFQRAGAEVIGLDYSPSLVELGRRAGIPMVEGGLEQMTGEYDIIVLSHVLEHFLDPVSALVRIRSHMAIGGVLFIEVPNILNFGMGQLQSAHTFYFSPRTLENIVGCVGLKPVGSGPARGIHWYMVAIAAEVRSIRTVFDPVAYAEVRGAVRRASRRERARSMLEWLGLLSWVRRLRERVST